MNINTSPLSTLFLKAQETNSDPIESDHMSQSVSNRQPLEAVKNDPKKMGRHSWFQFFSNLIMKIGSALGAVANPLMMIIGNIMGFGGQIMENLNPFSKKEEKVKPAAKQINDEANQAPRRATKKSKNPSTSRREQALLDLEKIHSSTMNLPL